MKGTVTIHGAIARDFDAYFASKSEEVRINIIDSFTIK